MRKPLQPAEINKEMLMGQQVFAARNKAVGCVSDVVGSGEDALIFVDLGGLFCIDGRTVVLEAREMEIGREENGAISLTTAQSPHDLDQLPAARP